MNSAAGDNLKTLLLSYNIFELITLCARGEADHWKEKVRILSNLCPAQIHILPDLLSKGQDLLNLKP